MLLQWLRFAMVVLAISLGTSAFVGCEMEVNEEGPLEETAEELEEDAADGPSVDIETE
jgi:hypothetical protein